MSDEQAEDEVSPGVAKAPLEAPGREHLKMILEALVFVADKPITALELSRAARSRVAEVRPLLLELVADHKGRGIELVEVAGGYQWRTAAVAAPFVRDAVAQRPVRLTRAQVETLAIVGYRQPVTRPEIDDIRGVDSGSALKVLLDRGLLKILGKKEEAGRPLLYGTTPRFLEFFGLGTLSELPTLREFAELSDESKALFEKRGLGALEVSSEEVAAETKAVRDAADAEAEREIEEAELASHAGTPAPLADVADEEEDDDAHGPHDTEIPPAPAPAGDAADDDADLDEESDAEEDEDDEDDDEDDDDDEDEDDDDDE